MRFPRSELFDSGREVVNFPVIIGNDAINCAISVEALQDHFGADQKVLPAFQANRSAIESVAARLIQKQRFEPDGSILIRTADC